MMLQEMRPLFEESGLSSPSTFDEAFNIFLSDKDKRRQSKLDATLSLILEKHHYGELAERYFSPAFKPSTFDREKYAQMPLEVLVDTIRLNKAMMRKWNVRADGWRMQEAMTSQAFDMSGYDFLRLHRDFCSSTAATVERARDSIEEFIHNLEELCKRSPS